MEQLWLSLKGSLEEKMKCQCVTFKGGEEADILLLLLLPSCANLWLHCQGNEITHLTSLVGGK